ncbi:hypothetical protein H2199_005378 [Coniosporium tulheliwenetii]|uniref:Uncharacterized protein n=1 Tax=Coniosporium tulheliwenetii TaxID=3383036 RepID=A0ACC2Z170_9PEZI|nr:hypothetical protein H2199_005378 [Cladosporium sp. JES 115]
MDQIKHLADQPKEFLKEGTQFLNRCQKPDRREFIKISQAVAMGFIIMGVRTAHDELFPELPHILTVTQTIGYFVKLIHIPVNNILVGGA